MLTPPTRTLPLKRASIESAGLPPSARSLPAKKGGISLPVTILDFLAKHARQGCDFTATFDRGVRKLPGAKLI